MPVTVDLEDGYSDDPAAVATLAAEVVAGRTDPYAAADALVRSLT